SWVVTAYLLAVTATTPLFGNSPTFMAGASSCFGDWNFHRRLDRLRIGADDLELGVRARPARRWRRRFVADRPDDHCGFVVASGTADRSGPHLDHVYECQYPRPGARRFFNRSAALVVDLLDQSAARCGGTGHERTRVTPIAAQRAAAPA